MKKLLTLAIASMLIAVPANAQQQEIKDKRCKFVVNSEVLINGECEVTYENDRVIRFSDGNFRTVCTTPDTRCAGYQERTASYGAFGYLHTREGGELRISHNNGEWRNAQAGFIAPELHDRNRCMVSEDWKSYLCIY